MIANVKNSLELKYLHNCLYNHGASLPVYVNSGAYNMY